jgi:hypothetical protein
VTPEAVIAGNFCTPRRHGFADRLEACKLLFGSPPDAVTNGNSTPSVASRALGASSGQKKRRVSHSPGIVSRPKGRAPGSEKNQSALQSCYFCTLLIVPSLQPPMTRATRESGPKFSSAARSQRQRQPVGGRPLRPSLGLLVQPGDINCPKIILLLFVACMPERPPSPKRDQHQRVRRYGSEFASKPLSDLSPPSIAHRSFTTGLACTVPCGQRAAAYASCGAFAMTLA